MALAICRIEVPHVSALPEEAITNTIYVGGTEDADVIADAVTNVLGDTLYAWTEDFGSSEMRWDLAQLIGYDAADPQPRTPVFTGSAGLTNATEANPLPPEVALCLSYQSEQISGQPKGRNRGRLYLGPFNEAANVTADSTRARPSSSLITSLATGAPAFSSSLGSLVWGLFSEADGAFKEIVQGWVDDA